ncbi:hypothetical protein CsSME_00008577 [Camellia sinensis var. sinensis]
MFPISALFTTTTTRLRFLSDQSSLRRLHRLFSTQSLSLDHTLSHPIYMIWGSNTGVGKTLVSAGIATSFLSPLSLSSTTISAAAAKFIYLKPVQTGFPIDSDSRFVYRKFSEIFLRRQPSTTVFASNHALKASISAAQSFLGGEIAMETEEGGELESGFRDLGWYEEMKLQGEVGEVTAKPSELICKTMYGWREAVSAHLAAEREGAMVEDSVLLGILKRSLGIGLEGGFAGDHKVRVLSVIETAGGVASPGPSGSFQCDLYRSLNMLPGLSGYLLFLLGMDTLVVFHQQFQLTKV